ncbi:MAG: hypothetical protein DRG78_05090 [Epsilonproteobacteria bacterium]|nr:MAG: hypothetical protein DRG78_05090 [Campylobacterota bacterium]
MKRLIIIVLLFSTTLFAKKIITSNEVYTQVRLIQQQVHNLHQHFGTIHNHDAMKDEEHKIKTKLKPRNSWQKTYEIMVKINILRNENGLPTIEPINMTPVLNLNPNLVYGMTRRILTELNLFHHMLDIKKSKQKIELYKGKTPLDVFNALTHVSDSLDQLNKVGFTPSYVFGENMRIYDDLTVILQHLNIDDKTIPASKDIKATPKDTFEVGMKMLSIIRQLQIKSGLDFVDYSKFRKKKITSSDVFTITGMIISELQTIKAYIGLNDSITPAAAKYNSKISVEVDQLMNWNLRKLSLIYQLEGKK